MTSRHQGDDPTQHDVPRIAEYEEPAEVWCANDERPSAETVNGTPLCSECLWKLRSKSWAGAPRTQPEPVGDMPDQITVSGHMFVHVAACPCPRIQSEVARLAVDRALRQDDTP